MGRQAQTLSPPPGVPPYFVADLIFPYTAGFSAALRAYRAGGWPAVDHLLAHPPTSTTELLHPERPDAPGTVPASELPPVPEGWEEVLTDAAGEWGLAFLLGRTMEVNHADAIAAAWDGDRLRLIRNHTNPATWALAWRLRCTSAQARQTLEEAMQHNLPGLLTRLAPPGNPRLTWVASGRTLEVRAAWPQPPPSPRSPS